MERDQDQLEEGPVDGDRSDEASEASEGEETSTESGEGPWDPWNALSHLQETVGGIVDSALRTVSPGGGRFPRYDLIELPDQGHRILFDLPGLEKGSVDVAVSAGALTVTGERPRPELPDGAKVERSERPYGRFRRTVELPAGADPARISARMENGVLEIGIPPRSEEDAQRIEVE